ncbi:MAG: FAD-linked oxidase C-terminal domain-containing protein [Deinococcales bacterium]
MDKAYIAQLQKLLKADQVSTSASVLAQHARGESYDHSVMPDVVIFPESTEDVQKVMAFAFEHGIAVTPVAVNSSLEGHTVPLHGGISLDVTRMNQVISFRPEDLLIICQPAMTYPQINEHAKRSGLFFPIDPGAHASIGGMISTNASGTMAVRYGVTADYVMGLEIVTPTGEIIQIGTKARKSSSGYNLTKLYCGAEGTLGVITEVTLKLVGLPEALMAARVPFKSISEASQFVISLIQAGVMVARCELVDANSIRAVNKHYQRSYPEEVTIFLEFQGNPLGIEREAETARELAEAMGAVQFEASRDPKARLELWEARHNLYYASVAAEAGKRNMTTDMAVPISKLAEVIETSISLCENQGFKAYAAGHVGDGNFHLLVFFEDGEEPKLDSLNHDLISLALKAGGTSTGEHGVGLRKLKYMAAEHGPALEVMRQIKLALDPKNIMNPGKKIPAKVV